MSKYALMHKIVFSAVAALILSVFVLCDLMFDRANSAMAANLDTYENDESEKSSDVLTGEKTEPDPPPSNPPKK